MIDGYKLHGDIAIRGEVEWSKRLLVLTAASLSPYSWRGSCYRQPIYVRSWATPGYVRQPYVAASVLKATTSIVVAEVIAVFVLPSGASISWRWRHIMMTSYEGNERRGAESTENTGSQQSAHRHPRPWFGVDQRRMGIMVKMGTSAARGGGEEGRCEEGRAFDDLRDDDDDDNSNLWCEYYTQTGMNRVD